MIERTFAPFACQNPLCLPAALEVGASNSQFVDEPANIRIVGAASHRGAKLCDDAMRTGCPVKDESSGLRPEEDVAQQVFFAVSIEPSCKQSRRFRVPSTRAPCAIEYVGGTIDRIDAGHYFPRWILPVVRPLGIA